MRISSIIALLALGFIGCSGSQQAESQQVTSSPPPGPTLSIEQPPSGALSDSQLVSIAEDIRRLEKHPLAKGAKQGRSNLMEWIQGSPDISVTLCKGVIGPLIESDSPHQSKLLGQFIFSNAAHKIENPDANSVSANVEGLKGALRAYRAIKKYRGEDARDEFMESIADRKDNGQLKSYVESGLQGC